MQPLVSIIIPCGPRHTEHVRLAAASVAWQSLADRCETIIACDGNAVVPPLPGVRILPSSGERKGPAHTRNRALAAAKGQFILPLDADDYLLPHTVEFLLREYSRGLHGYIYGDCYTVERNGQFVMRSAPDYIQHDVARYNLHVVTALTPTKHWRAVGGWDEGVDAWEDWSGHLRLAIAGVCGYRLPMPIFTYRVYEGDRMTQFYGGDPVLMEHVTKRYVNGQGEIVMASCCGGDADLARMAANALAGVAQPNAAEMADGKVRIEFLGLERGSITLQPQPGRSIRLGNNAVDRYADVTPEEAAWVAERLNVRVVPLFDGPDPPQPLQPIVGIEDVLTPDAVEAKAIRPRRGRPPGQAVRP